MPTTIQLADGPFEVPDPIVVEDGANRYRLYVTIPHPTHSYTRRGFFVRKDQIAADVRATIGVLLSRVAEEAH